MCRVAVETPINLNKRQKESRHELQASLSESGHKHSPRRSSWFEGVKAFFDEMKP